MARGPRKSPHRPGPSFASEQTPNLPRGLQAVSELVPARLASSIPAPFPPSLCCGDSWALEVAGTPAVAESSRGPRKGAAEAPGGGQHQCGLAPGAGTHSGWAPGGLNGPGGHQKGLKSDLHTASGKVLFCFLENKKLAKICSSEAADLLTKLGDIFLHHQHAAGWLSRGQHLCPDAATPPSRSLSGWMGCGPSLFQSQGRSDRWVRPLS